LRCRASAPCVVSTSSLHDALPILLPHGSIVVTLGAAGAFVSHPDGVPRGDGRGFYRVGAERVDAVDSTGAGDAFNGALAAAMARSEEHTSELQSREKLVCRLLLEK